VIVAAFFAYLLVRAAKLSRLERQTAALVERPIRPQGGRRALAASSCSVAAAAQRCDGARLAAALAPGEG
jgi:hypothetical protein